MTNLVFDASASVDLLLETAAGRSLDPKIPFPSRWWVPEHFYLEVASALRRAAISGKASPARVALAFASLQSARFQRAQVRPLLDDAWAMRHNLTIADALYVVLAEHLGGTLVTTDTNLTNAPTLSVPTITASAP